MERFVNFGKGARRVNHGIIHLFVNFGKKKRAGLMLIAARFSKRRPNWKKLADRINEINGTADC